MSVITITVGESEARFQAHKDLLCQRSPFFNGALTRDFKEASENAVTLPEDDPDTFERFLQWVYSGTYVLSGIGTDDEVDERYIQLVQLYTLADKLEVPALKKSVVDELFVMKSNPDKPPQIEVISYVYENTRERSPLRKLMVAWLVWHVEYSWYTTPVAASFLAQCPDFAADLVVALARRFVDFNALSPFNESPEKYYEESLPMPSSTVHSPLSDTPKFIRLVSTKKQSVGPNPGANGTQSTSGLRSFGSAGLGCSGVGPSRMASTLNLRTTDPPLRSPSLFSPASTESLQTPTFGGSMFSPAYGSTSSASTSNGF